MTAPTLCATHESIVTRCLSKTGHDEDGCEAKQIRTNLAKVCNELCRNYQETKP